MNAAPDASGVKRILVIILRHIGDVVLATPAIAALKNGFRDASIDALVNKGTEDALTFNPALDHIHVLDRGARNRGLVARGREEIRLVRDIRSRGYDMAVVLTTGNRALHMAYFSGARIRVGGEQPRAKKYLKAMRAVTYEVKMALTQKHYVERYLDIVRGLGISVPEGSMHTEFHESEEAAIHVKKMLGKEGLGEGDGYVVVHPTSRWMFKCWTPEKNSELIEALMKEHNVPVVLTSGPDASEVAFNKKITEGLRARPIDLSGRLTLKELGALVRGASVFFGVDSAPMHIACAVGTPVVALFGPTNEEDWGPWGKGHTVITSSAYSHCRPCNKDGCKGTKISDCLTSIAVAPVFEAVTEQLERTGALKGSGA